MLCLLTSPNSLLLLSKTHLALPKTLTLTRKTISFLATTMSINLKSHAFAGNPLRSRTPKPGDAFSPTSAFETLKTRLVENTHQQIAEPSSPDFKILPFRKGRPLASSSSGETAPNWHLGWISLADCRDLMKGTGTHLGEDSLVYLGSRSEDDAVYWAIDVSGEGSLVSELGSKRLCFVELRTLMVATDWADNRAMGELAVAGHARALLEWHNTSRFCGYCGEKTIPKEGGRRKQCSDLTCNKRIYPRVDPVY